MDFDITSRLSNVFTKIPLFSSILFSTCLIICLAASYYWSSKTNRFQQKISSSSIKTPTKPKRIISNSSRVSKVCFPHLILPSSTMVVSFIDFLISSTLMFWHQFVSSLSVLLLSLLILLTFFAALGRGLWFTTLNIKYRDFRFIVSFVVQIGLYASLMGFSNAIVSER